MMQLLGDIMICEYMQQYRGIIQVVLFCDVKKKLKKWGKKMFYIGFYRKKN